MQLTFFLVFSLANVVTILTLSVGVRALSEYQFLSSDPLDRLISLTFSHRTYDSDASWRLSLPSGYSITHHHLDRFTRVLHSILTCRVVLHVREQANYARCIDGDDVSKIHCLSPFPAVPSTVVIRQTLRQRRPTVII